MPVLYIPFLLTVDLWRSDRLKNRRWRKKTRLFMVKAHTIYQHFIDLLVHPSCTVPAVLCSAVLGSSAISDRYSRGRIKLVEEAIDDSCWGIED